MTRRRTLYRRPLRRYRLQRIGTSRNNWQAVQGAVTAWYDMREAK
jgi:hypothetical protein